jgi:hypothetical protein
VVLRVGWREDVEDGAGPDCGEGVQVATAAREEHGRLAGQAAVSRRPGSRRKSLVCWTRTPSFSFYLY